MSFKNSSLADSELAQMICLKSQAGAEVLYDRYAAALMLCIIRIVPQKETAENVLQQTFMEAWNNFESHSSDTETILAWMMRIARNRAHDAATDSMPQIDIVTRFRGTS
jgi:DNA-directed RNA polymerase specialized sigma24 family protein